MDVQRGTLLQFRGTWGSGMGILQIQNSDTGTVQNVPCDNAPTVRALENCFGNVITEGHTAGGDGYKGQEVYYSCDGLLLVAFTPVDDANPELIEAYEEARKEDTDVVTP